MILDLTMATKSDVPFSLWNSYVYKIVDTYISQIQCAGSCYLDAETPCHFYVYHENNCYLGAFDQSNSLVEPSSLEVNVSLNKGKPLSEKKWNTNLNIMQML